LIGLVYGVYGV